MSISGIGSNTSYLPSAPTGGARSGNAAAPTDASGALSSPDSASGGGGAYQFLVNYLKESPAKRMEDAWLAQHHLTEQALNAMPPQQQQAAIRKQMAEDIKKKMQDQGGASGTGAVLNIKT